MLAWLVPVVAFALVFISQPTVVKLTGSWVIRRDCPRARWEPARTCEEGFCCFGPHPRFEAAVQGLLSVRAEGMARGLALASRLSRTEVDVARLAPAGQRAVLMLRVAVARASTTLEEDGRLRESFDRVLQALGSAAEGVDVTDVPGSRTFAATFADAASLLRWRSESPELAALLAVVPHWSQEIRMAPSRVEVPARLPASPASLANASLLPHRPPLLFKVFLIIAAALYIALFVAGYPAGQAVTRAGAPLVVGSLVATTVAVPIVGFGLAPLFSLLLARWLHDSDSDECHYCPARVRNFFYGGIYTCCPDRTPRHLCAAAPSTPPPGAAAAPPPSHSTGEPHRHK